ncbi:MAG: hypothetical protein GY803_15745 [Chloroflexi bacterium]|nr:hypothetical protein [Chloroflexota bacterium]
MELLNERNAGQMTVSELLQLVENHGNIRIRQTNGPEISLMSQPSREIAQPAVALGSQPSREKTIKIFALASQPSRE